MILTSNNDNIFFQGFRGEKRTGGWLTARGWLFAAVLVALSMMCGQSSQAQQITGAIAGTVTDQQGAFVPNAMVKATNSATGYTRSVVSDAGGAYNLQYLPVGSYTVQVTAPGFKTFVQQNLEITVDQTQALPVALAIGTVDQTVTVTTAPPLVNTTSETLGRTISPAEINNLPLVNRNAYTELSLTPGIQSNSASSQTNSSGSPNFVLGVPSTQVIVNGGVDGGVPMVSFYLDGGFNMTGLRNYGNALPNPDALEEFRVETSNFAAQYGRMSGAVVTAVTKSGTNHFHGSAFEFIRNTALNAYSWVPTGAQNPMTKQNQPLHRNQFGVTVGGPIKKDKAFFFFSYGGLRQTAGQQLTGAIVPTALERLGDFTQSPVLPNQPGTKTPWTGVNTSSNCQTMTAGCIPLASLDPTAANLIAKLVPLPNTNITTGGKTYLEGYTGSYTSPTTEDEYLGKYDQQIGEKDHLFASYFTIKSVSGAYGGGNIPYMVNQSNARQQDLNVSDVHTISASKANQVWATITRVAGGRVNLPAADLSSFGSDFTIQGPKAYPQLSISSGFNAGGSLAGPVSNTNFYGIRDVFSMTLGNHNLNIGGEFSLEKDAVQGNLYNFGIFNFQTSGPTSTGNVPQADFVAGLVASMEQDTPYATLTSYFFGAGFVQDAWKITPRLTANLGLRYDIEEAPVESRNHTTAFVPGQQSTVVPSAPLGVLFPGDTGISRGVGQTSYDHVSPRVGLVFDPFGNGKTAIRAGAGMFFGSVSGNEWNQPGNAQPFAIRQTFQSIASFTNIYGDPASFPNGDPFPYNYNATSPRFLPAAAVESIDPKYKWPVSYQLNAAVEQQMPAGISLQVAYVGNFVRHVPDGIDGNNPVYAAGATATQTSITARRPYNDNGALGQVILITSGQTANYNSLQVSAHKALTSHLLLNGFYVWSHSLWSANSSAIGISTAQNYSDLQEERGPSDNDRRNASSISAVYKIDYYHGDSLLVRNVANGWKVSTIAFFNSGTPFNVTTGSDKNLDGYNNDRPNLAPGVTKSQIQLGGHRSRFVEANSGWFNTMVNGAPAFVANGPGVAGGIGPGGADGNVPRDYLVGPGYRDIDMAVERDFVLPRGTGFEFRAEATNAFNMVSLNNPTGTLSAANFGQISGAAPMRIFQFGGRFTF
ncbi:TonB-dependent receptor [Granulicella sp. 5B5]|uniref:TonB-dependent receptor n=1 Tax=Granulicella sp. 5B5 TaxID=1617967 RepID=UPI0015F63E92|nr:carboxypeptidase-like regulatory domain-containing protein [Granulicella sp. 5B5]QMV17643.1 TonB-dependent receptor [Granulicella sp. 5B5]